MANNYTGVEVQRGLLGVRNQIPMYLGATGVESEKHAPRALTQMAQEVISNSRDEVLAGYGDKINVTIHEDNSMTVQDFGRGMPKGPGESFQSVIDSLTETHASGKFDADAYAVTGVSGMHGIGLKAVNAASKRVDIHAISHSIKENSQGEKALTGKLEEWKISFKQEDVLETELIRTGIDPEDAQTGTTITFYPDDGPISEKNSHPVLESIVWTVNDLIPRMESSAFLMPGLRVTLTDERSEMTKEWYYENGLTDYVKELSEGQTPVKGLDEPIVISGVSEIDGYPIEFNGAILFTKSVGSSIVSYANGVPTREGGPHVDGFRNALTRAFELFSDETPDKTKKGKTEKLTESDVFEGVVAAFETRVPGDIASFEGQTKEKLGTMRAKPATKNIVENEMLDWIHDHKPVAEEILEQMRVVADSRVAAAKARREIKKARETKRNAKLNVSGKLKRCSSKDPSLNEMYIVEGDSASNIGRNPKYQAVFPLRGKIRNAYELALGEALKNKEISTIAAALGAGIGPEFDPAELAYQTVIMTTDGDSDGAHIRLLLTGLFYRFFPGLIENGHLYYVQSPLYKAEKYIGDELDVRMYYSEIEMAEHRDELEGYTISRYKGLGAMESGERKVALANPETRKLVRVTVQDAQKARMTLNAFLGDNSQLRAKWIAENVVFDDDIDE